MIDRYLIYNKEIKDVIRYTESKQPVIYNTKKEAEKDKLLLKTDVIISADDYNKGNFPID